MRKIEGEKILFFDGERVPDKFIRSIDSESRFFDEPDLVFEDKGILEHLRGIKFCDFLGRESVAFIHDHYFDDDFKEFKVDYIIVFCSPELSLSLCFNIDFRTWDYPWSMHRQIQRFHEKLKINMEDDWEISKYEDTWMDFPNFYMSINKQQKMDGDLYQELSCAIEKLKLIQQEIFEEEGFFSYKSSVQRDFDFPEEVKIYCEQYLIYFAQFLKDAGVEATASITEEDGKSIFRVKPKNKDEALEKIQEALAIYLNLPAVVTLDQFPNMNDGVEVQRLYSNIQHLQSQLGLALATIRQQNILIQGKDQMIDQQNRLIAQNIESGRILMESMQSEDESSAEIIDGVASVKKYEIGPLEIDLPNIFRKVKEMFDRPDED